MHSKQRRKGVTEFSFHIFFLLIIFCTASSSVLSILAKWPVCAAAAHYFSNASILITGLASLISFHSLYIILFCILLSGLIISMILKTRFYAGLVSCLAFLFIVSSSTFLKHQIPLLPLLLAISLIECGLVVGVNSYLNHPRNGRKLIKVHEYFDRNLRL